MVHTGTEPFYRSAYNKIQWAFAIEGGEPPGSRPTPTHPIIPDDHLLPMRSRKYMIMLSIPLDLRPGLPPSTQADQRAIVVHPHIPCSDPGIHRDRCHEVWIACMPIDIGDGAGVGVNGAKEDSGGLGGEVPY